MRRRLVGVSLLANLLGALLIHGYFRFIDTAGADPATRSPSSDLVPFAVGFAVVALVGLGQGLRWSRPVMAAAAALRRGQTPPAAIMALARRRALSMPLAVAGVTLLAWGLAGLVFGVIWPLLLGGFSVGGAVRSVFGIVGIAGTATAAFTFFAIEHVWRRDLPRFFPDGLLGDAASAARPGVRARLLGSFLLVGVGPLSVLGVLAYRRATTALGPDPSVASVHGLVVLIVFLVTVGVVAAVGLGLLVARSVAGPLRTLAAAMGEVARGRLDQQCPVTGNDEIGALNDGFNRMVQGLRERDAIKATFGKYVTEEIRDEILADRVTLEGQLCEATILFADLRDFTPWVEATPPREVVRDLNAYFTEMEQAIRHHGGLVLQFIGDEIEAVFGAPVACDDHAARAVRAAVEMRTRLAAWNGRRDGQGRPPLRHGIGIHTGTVLAGNIGSAERLAYTLVGDPVNLASRLQGLTRDLGTDVLVSGATRARLGDGPDLERLPSVRVKGRSEEVDVYRLP